MIPRITVKSRSRNELVDITATVTELVRNSGVKSGICHLTVLHTTAGITINEGADPDVRRDMTAFLNRLVPIDHGFAHSEGNSDAHIKSSLVGTTLALLVDNGAPLLGTWQAIYLWEFDGPRERTIAVKICADP